MKDGLSHKDRPQNYLLVEGSGDIHVFGSLLNYHQIISNNYKDDRRFKTKYVLPDCPLALQLVDWIRNLFELQSP